MKRKNYPIKSLSHGWRCLPSVFYHLSAGVALQNSYHSAVDSLGKQVFDLQVQLNQKSQQK